MSTQEQVEKNVRLALGDMHLQLIVANANLATATERIATLEAEIVALTPEAPPAVNGKLKDAPAKVDKPN